MTEISMTEANDKLYTCIKEVELLFQMIIRNDGNKQFLRVDNDSHPTSSSMYITKKSDIDLLQCEQSISVLLEKCECKKNLMMSFLSKSSLTSPSRRMLQSSSDSSSNPSTWMFIIIVIGAFIVIFFTTWLFVYCYRIKNWKRNDNNSNNDQQTLYKTDSGIATVPIGSTSFNNDIHASYSMDTDIRVYDVTNDYNDIPLDTNNNNIINNNDKYDVENFHHRDSNAIESTVIESTAALNGKQRQKSLTSSLTLSNSMTNNNNTMQNEENISPNSVLSYSTTVSEAAVVPSSIKGKVKSMTHIWESSLRSLLLSSIPKPTTKLNETTSVVALQIQQSEVEQQEEQQQSEELQQQEQTETKVSTRQRFPFWNNEVERWNPSYLPTALVNDEQDKRSTINNNILTSFDDNNNRIYSASSSPVCSDISTSVSAIPFSLRQKVFEMTKSWEQGLKITLTTPKTSSSTTAQQEQQTLASSIINDEVVV